MPILNDSIFFEYSSPVATGTAAQRTAAYRSAETLAGSYLGTPLEETTFTGTVRWPWQGDIQLPHTHLKHVRGTFGLFDDDEDEETLVATGTSFVQDYENSLVRVVMPDQPIGAPYSRPHRIRISYSAGIGLGTITGTSTYLMALSMIAEEELEQIVDPRLAAGGRGNVGIQQWSELGYSEKRIPLRVTSLGSSPRASYAARLLAPLKGQSGKVAKL